MSKDQLNRLIDGYLTAYAACDAQGCAAIFTADGALYSPYGPPAHGHAEIAATHVKWFAENEEDKTIEVTEYSQGCASVSTAQGATGAGLFGLVVGLGAALRRRRED